MINIMKNLIKILFKRKSFIITTFILPVLLILAFTTILYGSADVKIGIINEDNGILGDVVEEKLESLDGFNVVKLEPGDYSESLVYHKYEMIVKIDDDFTETIKNGGLSQIGYETINSGDTEPIVDNILESEVGSLSLLCNNIDFNNKSLDDVISTFKNSKPSYEVINNKDKEFNIQSSLGMVLYMIFISTGVSCQFLLEDEKNGTKERVLMSSISERKYYAAQCLVYFLFSTVPAIEYYLICIFRNFNFGFENKIMLLLITLLMSLFSVVTSVLITSVIKNKTVFLNVATGFSVPLFMLSGCYWPFDFMGETLQKIGNALPPRWVVLSIEKLQQGGDIVSIFPMIFGMLLVCIFFFLLSVFFTRNKIVFVK